MRFGSEKYIYNIIGAFNMLKKEIGQCSKVGIPKSGHTVKKWAHHLFSTEYQESISATAK